MRALPRLAAATRHATPSGRCRHAVCRPSLAPAALGRVISRCESGLFGHVGAFVASSVPTGAGAVVDVAPRVDPHLTFVSRSRRVPGRLPRSTAPTFGRSEAATDRCGFGHILPVLARAIRVRARAVVDAATGVDPDRIAMRLRHQRSSCTRWCGREQTCGDDGEDHQRDNTARTPGGQSKVVHRRRLRVWRQPVSGGDSSSEEAGPILTGQIHTTLATTYTQPVMRPLAPVRPSATAAGEPARRVGAQAYATNPPGATSARLVSLTKPAPRATLVRCSRRRASSPRS
jgi:hypothetical protein